MSLDRPPDRIGVRWTVVSWTRDEGRPSPVRQTTVSCFGRRMTGLGPEDCEES